MASSMQCALKDCQKDTLTPSMQHVKVKSFTADVPQEVEILFKVSWQGDGRAEFHWDCWEDLTQSLNTDKPFQMPAREKDKVTEAKKTAEYFNSADQVKSEGERIAEMLKSAKHAVVFTGAGISTSAGIGDFRGIGGKWTERDRQRKYGAQKSGATRKPGVHYNELRPTYFHEAIAKLIELGLIKYVISQNVDGLHRLSGIPEDKLAELHGNVFHEKCETCEARYERSHSLRNADSATVARTKVPVKKCKTCGHNHRTGNKCEKRGCSGYLMKTIINFGDMLETNILETAEQQAERSDLMLSFGSSLHVTPACDLVTLGEKPLRLVVCNRQTTPFDDVCQGKTAKGQPAGSRVFGDCDDVMRHVMTNILPDEEIQKWETDRNERMKEYAKKRS